MWKVALAFAVILLFIPLSGALVAAELVPGLDMRVENCLTQVRAGDTLTFQVKVTNDSGQTVQGTLRAYLYGNANYIAYPLPSSGMTVYLHEGGRDANDRNVEIPTGEQTFSISISIRSDVQLIYETSPATIRVRFGQVVENGIFVDNVSAISKSILIFPSSGPESMIPVKLGIGVAVATALILAVMNLRKLSGTSVRKPSHRSVRRRAHRARVKS